GGGLTSFGGEVLLLPYSGKVFAATSGDDVRLTNVAAPDNNRAAYQAIADSAKYAGYRFNKDYLRYNDLHYFKSADAHGLLASYTEYHPGEECFTNTIAKLVFAPEAASISEVAATGEDWDILYRSEPCLPFKKRYVALEGNMAGGRMAFAPPATLYYTNGDFHWDGMRSEQRLIAQDPEAHYGKVMAIDIASGEARIVSAGHRNPQGIVVDGTGRVFVVEHGPRGGDELNLVREGANYGWPLESLGTTYGGQALPDALSYGRHETYEPPLYSWVPSVATSAMTIVEGFDDSWDGDLLIGSLIDHSLHRVRFQDDRPLYSERIDMDAWIRDVHQHTDGRIVVWTTRSQLSFLSVADTSAQDMFVADAIAEAELRPAMQDKVVAAVAECAQCHALVANDNARSPSLSRVFGADIASTTYEGYSHALKDKRGRWTREALTRFVDDPSEFAEGTTMPDPHIDDPAVLEEVVSFLERLKTRW
ncbi:MAG: PQQ-dependent sugar dehydrogenase, partial [Caulobacterales bacterium]|nr:PQQ-dependent sugar dehydrogenase [Caulobacterales bacterium]